MKCKCPRARCRSKSRQEQIDEIFEWYHRRYDEQRAAYIRIIVAEQIMRRFTHEGNNSRTIDNGPDD